MVVDPDQLAEQLEAAYAARDRVNRVIDWLEEGVALFAGARIAAVPELEPPAVAAPVLEPGDEEDLDDVTPEPVDHGVDALAAPVSGPTAMPPLPRSRASGRDFRAKVLHVCVKTNTALKFAEIHAQVGGSVSYLRRILQELVAEQRIEATGKTSSRRYKGCKPDTFHSELRTKQEAAKVANAAKVADGIERVVFRDKVAKAIAADPGLTVDQLAQGLLEADHDDVDEACRWLVERHHATVDETGGHHRHTTGRARLRAAA